METESSTSTSLPTTTPSTLARSNLHGGVSSASEPGTWTSTIGARVSSPTYPFPTIPSEPAAVCRTPCRSAAGTPPNRSVDVTPRSLRRPRPLQRLVRQRRGTARRSFSATYCLPPSGRSSMKAILSPSTRQMPTLVPTYTRLCVRRLTKTCVSSGQSVRM